MGNPKGFIEIEKKLGGYRPVNERIFDFGEVEQTLDDQDRINQASRCMDCGVPFCHWACPVGSNIPEWQDAVYHEKWDEAYSILTKTNSFPEFTGRVCPAPCEKSCVLAIHDESVTIRENECAVVEHAFDLNLVHPNIPEKRSGKEIAVVGSGPSGLSVADLLNQAGHTVTVFEQDDEIGGLLRYGIPDFKLNKGVIDRRVDLFVKEGVIFKTNIKVGEHISEKTLLNDFDAVCIACGAMQPRDLKSTPGRDLMGVYFAMDYLKQQNKVVRGESIPDSVRIHAKDKKVLVIGGGDTGSDCVGTAIRQRALSVTQIEILDKPAEKRTEDNPWPFWPNTLRTSSSHLEGCERRWSLNTRRFIGENGVLKGVEVVRVEWTKNNGQFAMREIPGTEEVIEADLVLLALGFVSPVHEGLLDRLQVEYDARGNVKATDFATSIEKIFVAGDATRGASLVVHAIRSGRDAALKIHEFVSK
ncbi:MAG: glutamate synthase subunit beta [Bacteroidetes bacterium]|nr:glutamate synthase subunit beta [Bacteroidota bacterium]MCL6104003.1 glutamate synthase subunit beta [Bacteroidota bacterium]